MIAILLLRFLCSSCLFLFMLADLNRRAYAKDTEGRYYWASIEHGLKYFALASPVVGAIYNIMIGMYIFMPVEALLFVLILGWVRRFHDDDDDNFWRKLGKKWKKKAQDFAANLKPNPLPSPI